MGGVVIASALALFAVLALAVLVPMGRAFMRELRYVDSKIMGSRHEKEETYWINRRKRLLKSLLPFHHYYRDEHHRHHRDDNSDTQ